LTNLGQRDDPPPARYFPDAPALYAQRNWRLPSSIGKVYDASQAGRVLGYRCETDFGRVLDALRAGRTLRFDHDRRTYRKSSGLRQDRFGHWQRWRNALLILALTGCAQGITCQATAPNGPYSLANHEIRPERGGGDGGDSIYLGSSLRNTRRTFQAAPQS
jgi:hypothetical protein